MGSLQQCWRGMCAAPHSGGHQPQARNSVQRPVACRNGRQLPPGPLTAAASGETKTAVQVMSGLVGQTQTYECAPLRGNGGSHPPAARTRRQRNSGRPSDGAVRWSRQPGSGCYGVRAARHAGRPHERAAPAALLTTQVLGAPGSGGNRGAGRNHEEQGWPQPRGHGCSQQAEQAGAACGPARRGPGKVGRREYAAEMAGGGAKGRGDRSNHISSRCVVPELGPRLALPVPPSSRAPKPATPASDPRSARRPAAWRATPRLK
ncbi:MAG: hypothetical protein J3K34DRAFT_8214 [Monoraphidium minutum]|nr:MAG: hypothetical protein J3K34DRAFT_8214 [Monoraphidium minutum]